MADSIKIRVELRRGIATVSAMLRHPMETGSRKDQVSRAVIPAHYIQEVVCRHNGEVVLSGYWGPGISKNPFLSFQFSGAKRGDVFSLAWTDNLGAEDSMSLRIK